MPLVALIHNRGAAKCAWRIGDAFLKVTYWVPALPSEAENIDYVSENIPGIPVPEVVHGWVDEKMRRTFTITKAMPGETLEVAWPELTEFQRQGIAAQVSLICDVLRTAKVPCLQSVSGGPVNSGYYTPHDAEVQPGEHRWEPDLNGPATLEYTRASFAPLDMEDEFVLIHGDLAPCKFMVKDGSLSGIIDWQTAGFYPRCWVWFNFFRVDMCLSYRDIQESLQWMYWMGEELKVRGIGGHHREAIQCLQRLNPKVNVV